MSKRSKTEVEAIESAMGVLSSIIHSIVELVKKFGGTMENIYRLATPEGSETLEKIARLIVGAAEEAKKRAEEFFQSIGQIVIPARAGEFVAKDFFVVNTAENAPAKISYVGENFGKRYLGKTEKPFSGSILAGRQLTENALDEKIIAKIGGKAKAETTLYEVYIAITQQPNGPNSGCGKLKMWNIFYVLDVNGVLGAVIVHWYGDGWDVDADELGDEWGAGDAVFSRN
jgi:hypothetical protein